MSETASGNPTIASTASDFATFGAVHLDVTDLGRALPFWRDLIGLDLLGRDDTAARLGVADRELIVLHPGARGPVVREAAGLYHLAFHLPSLAEFARAFARIEAAGYFQFPTDHGTHLANYIDDPDGIGLEFAFETPPEVRAPWRDEPGFEARDGEERVWGGRDPRYLAWLAAHAPADGAGAALPGGTIVGHMHLRVADADAALAFYRDTIGFTTNMDGRARGMFDMSAGGTFPHRLACNTWESAGRPQRPADAAGMRRYTIALRSAGDLAAAVARVEAAGHRAEHRDGAALVTDPAGIALLLTGPAAGA